MMLQKVNEPSLRRTKLVKAAIRAGVCLNPQLYDEYSTFFVVAHPSGTFYISQSVAAMDKLIGFLKKHGVELTTFVALRSQTRSFLGMCMYSRVEWMHKSKVEKRRAREYIYLHQWLAEEHMRPLAKPICYGGFTGGRLIPTDHLGFQEIVKSNGKTARFVFLLRYVPNILVQWMTAYPL